MSIEEYEKLSEERPDLLRIIDGSVYYSFDYTDYLYNELEKRDNIINKIEKYCNHGIKEYITDDGFVEEVLQDVLNIIKKLKEKKDE